MNYSDGSKVLLGDVVALPVPDGTQEAQVVMLGDTLTHLDLEEHFVDWVIQEKLLDGSRVVVQWLAENPFRHSKPSYAPIGDKMFTPVDEFVELVKRAGVQ